LIEAIALIGFLQAFAIYRLRARQRVEPTLPAPAAIVPDKVFTLGRYVEIYYMW
jgi:hypothetical protein